MPEHEIITIISTLAKEIEMLKLENEQLEKELEHLRYHKKLMDQLANMEIEVNINDAKPAHL